MQSPSVATSREAELQRKTSRIKRDEPTIKGDNRRQRTNEGGGDIARRPSVSESSFLVPSCHDDPIASPGRANDTLTPGTLLHTTWTVGSPRWTGSRRKNRAASSKKKKEASQDMASRF
ncbi:hypothetical protein THAOC_29457, partial [Thalassiosira oceanica]